MDKINAMPHFIRENFFAASTAVLLFFCALVQPALAAESAGVIMAFSGKAEIVRGQETRQAAIRAELYSGDTIVTGEGQVQIRFVDGTMLTLYRDTKFSVDDYHYGKGNGDRARFSLLNGLMHTLTGDIDKRNYQLTTRLANLGVRGTEYSVQLNESLHVSVDQGRVSLANAGGSILVGAGQSVIVTGQNVMPQPVMGGKLDLRHGGGGRPGGGPGGHGGGPGGMGGPGGAGPGGAGGPGGSGGGMPPPAGTQKLGQ